MHSPRSNRWLAILFGIALAISCSHAHADVTTLTSWTIGLTGPDPNTAGTDRLLIFTAGMERYGDQTITSVTYGGQAMTQAAVGVAGPYTYSRSYIFYLNDAGISAASGNSFVVNWTNTSSKLHYAARLYQGVNQDSPIGDVDSNTGSSTPNPITTSPLDVAAGDMVVAVAQSGMALTYTWNNGFTEGVDFEASGTSQHSTADKAITSSGTQIASATNAPTPNRQVMLGVVLQKPLPPPETYYVRPDGNNSNTGLGSGTSEAWQTVTHATTSSDLNPGDIVNVMTGTYTGAIDPSIDGTSSAPIRLIADRTGTVFGTAGNVTLKASSGNEAVELYFDNYLEFVGFRIEGVSGSSQEVIELDNSYGIVMEQCEIFNGDSDGVDASNSSLTLINCLIYDNGGHGIEATNSATVTVWNSTIAHNGFDGVTSTSSTTTVHNCILAYNSDDGFDRNAGTLTHSYNLVYGNSGDNFDGTGQGAGELTTDPMFANTSTRDYHLQSNSPAINAGTNASGTVDIDLDGTSRPIGADWDMGCYEYALLGHWTFDEGSGTTAADSSGNSNDATLKSSAGWTAARCANALSLDGSSAWADLGQIDIGSAGYAVAAWFKSSSTTQQTIFAATVAGTDNHLMFLELGTDGQVHFTHRYPAGSSGGVTISSTNTLSDGYWHFVAAVKSGSEMVLYVDGELAAQTAEATGVVPSLDMVVGRSGKALAQNYFSGTIDEVHVYGMPLSARDVGLLSGLIARWRFDESSGTLAEDSSLFSNDATLYGTPTWGPTTGTVLGALQCNGSTDYVEAASNTSLDLADNFTVSGWFRLDSTFDDTSTTSLILVDKYYDNTKDFVIVLAGTDYNYSPATEGSLVVKVENGNGYAFSWTTTTSWNKNKWYHFALVHYPDNPSGSQLFIGGADDTEDAFGSSTGIGIDFSAPFRIGGKQADTFQLSSTHFFDGRLDDFRIYNRALCSDEVDDQYHSGLQYRVRISEWIEIR